MQKRMIVDPTFKIMYHPETLEIRGMTDGDVSMFTTDGKPYPYVETKTFYHSFDNLGIEIIKGKAKLKILKGTL